MCGEAGRPAVSLWLSIATSEQGLGWGRVSVVWWGLVRGWQGGPARVSLAVVKEKTFHAVVLSRKSSCPFKEKLKGTSPACSSSPVRVSTCQHEPHSLPL